MASKYFFIAAAAISVVFSIALWFAGDTELSREQAIFVGLWAPSILGLGNLIK